MTILDGAYAESPDADDGWTRAHMTSDGVEVIYLDHVRYERDPLSAVFDDIDEDDLDMLAANIKAEGQKLPVTINQATRTVVDGWQRLRACWSIRMKPVVAAIEIENPPAFVMAVNVHRRDVEAKNAGQRVLQAMDLFAAERDAVEGKKPRKATAKQIGAAAGCSAATIDMVRRALRWDDENQENFYEPKLRAGKISAKRAYDQITEREAKDKSVDEPDADAESDSGDSLLDAVEQILRGSGGREPLAL